MDALGANEYIIFWSSVSSMSIFSFSSVTQDNLYDKVPNIKIHKNTWVLNLAKYV